MTHGGHPFFQYGTALICAGVIAAAISYIVQYTGRRPLAGHPDWRAAVVRDRAADMGNRICLRDSPVEPVRDQYRIVGIRHNS